LPATTQSHDLNAWLRRRINGITIGPLLNFEALMAAMAYHGVRPVIGRVFPIAEYRQAYHRIASSDHVGKVVVEMDPLGR
jgi:D-arabinose 1-dehydrogenase-like Zn-dependent alcohol dehydrogenase